MKILLLLPASPSASPYLRYYLNVFDTNDNVKYDVCVWNRSNDIINEKNYFVFNSRNANSRNPLSKVKSFEDYRKFIINKLKECQYDRIVVFTIQLAIYLSKVLLQQYKGKYIVDIRDYSKILKIPFSYNILSKTLRNSAMNCISSQGFRYWLPKDSKYVVSHNILKEDLLYVRPTQRAIRHNGVFNILTIGTLRNLESNLKLVYSLANNKKYILTFAGQGPATNSLKNLVDTNNYENIVVSGKYQKAEERDIVQSADMINLLLPDDLNSRTCMANRFYLSVVYRVPMIVDSDTFEGKCVQKYHLGAVIQLNDNIEKKILEYWQEMNYNLYNEGCEAFIKEVLKDINLFESKLKNIIAENE